MDSEASAVGAVTNRSPKEGFDMVQQFPWNGQKMVKNMWLNMGLTDVWPIIPMKWWKKHQNHLGQYRMKNHVGQYGMV